LAFVGCATAGWVKIPYTNCTSTYTDVAIQTAEISMWPPQKGTPFSIHVAASLLSDISGGNYNFQLLINGYPLINHKGTIQDLAEKLNVTLPIQAGNFNVQKNNLELPNIPDVDLSISLDAQDELGHEILCIKGQLDVMKA